MAMAILAVVVTAMNPETSDPLLQRCGVVQHRLEINTFGGEQAREGLTIGCDPQSVAVPTKRLTDGGDDPKSATVIAKTPTVRRRTGIAAQGLQGPSGLNPTDHLSGREHLILNPTVPAAHIHVFDQPQFKPISPC